MPNTTCRRSSCMASQQIRRVTGSGAFSCRNESRSTKLPSPSTESRNDANAKSDSVDEREQRRRPPADDVPISAPRSSARRREDLHVPCLVGHLHGEQLHHLAKVRVDAPHEPGRHDEGGLLVLDQVGHHLHHRGFDVGRQRELVVPRHRGLRVPLSGGGLRVQVRSDVGPDQVAVVQVEPGLRAAGFEERAPRPEPPPRRRTAAERRRLSRPGPLRAEPAVVVRRPSDHHRHQLARLAPIRPLDPMTPATTPGGQVYAQRRIAPGDRQPAAGRQPGQGALHEQVRAPAETQVTQVDLGDRCRAHGR